MEWFFSLINTLLTWWPLVALFLLIVLYWKTSSTHGTWRDQGIPGPNPVPFFGINPLRLMKIGTPAFFKECVQKYGNVCGVFVGNKPVLVVTDPEVIKQVYVKEFSNFMNRVGMDLQLPFKSKSVAGLMDDDWRRVRNTITPIFSAAKMKQMVPLMNEGLETLVDKLGSCADSGETVNLGEMYGKFTMETIFKSAFGIDAKNQTDPNDKYTLASAEIIKTNYLFTILTMFVPFTRILVLAFRRQMSAVVFLMTAAKNMIKTRHEEGHPGRTDLLKLMMEAEIKSDNGTVINKLTDKEIEAQCATFLIAGYETTATALTFASYVLASQPEIQEKLRAEIDEYFPGDVQPDYDTVTKLEYLDKVFNETLRMYPPGQTIARPCKEECTISGIRIPKGAVVVVHINSLHHDPEIWEQPEKFDPERFSPKSKATRHQFAYIPFSLGPRNCVGMRFAVVEAKTALIQVLRKFKIQATAETKFKLNTKEKLVLSAEGGILVKFVKRDT